MSDTRLFAVIPAAGHSRRMGKPKLMLPVGEKTLIARVIETFSHPQMTSTIVVCRQDDADLQRELAQTSAVVVTPDIDPPQMRDSIELALDEIERRFEPTDDDAWVLCPADHPLLDVSILGELIHGWQQCQTPVQVPIHQGQRGHPVFFRWSTVVAIRALPDNVGVNAFLKMHPEYLTTLDIADGGVLVDLDTPTDYASLCERWSDRKSSL